MRKRTEESAFNWPVIGVDIPYPPHVQAALDRVEAETQRRERLDNARAGYALPIMLDVSTAEASGPFATWLRDLLLIDAQILERQRQVLEPRDIGALRRFDGIPVFSVDDDEDERLERDARRRSAQRRARGR